MNSPVAINNIKYAVKNIATKITPTRLEISLKKRRMLRGKQACHITNHHLVSHGVRRNFKRDEREKGREEEGK